jgi:hypothetical protein
VHISITMSGGLAGIEQTGVIDTESLPSDAAARIEGAVEALSSRGPESGEIGADLFEYRVQVTGDQGERTFVVTDLGEPEGPQDPALAELIRTAGLGS